VSDPPRIGAEDCAVNEFHTLAGQLAPLIPLHTNREGEPPRIDLPSEALIRRRDQLWP